jgi:DNA-binding transcriptional regulator YhcF (GntR family)
MIVLHRDSGVPLAHQIGLAIRYRIATGRLAPGSVLPSYRAAALEWGVNLHTVRRAYLELARAGLVRIDDRRGATVLEDPRPEPNSSLDRFAAEVVDLAEQQFGVDLETLVDALRRQRLGRSTRPPVWIVECSQSLSDALADQVATRWAVEAKGRLVRQAASIPPGVVVSTYFHFAELRRLLPERARDLEAVHIRPALALLDSVRAHLSGNRAHRVTLVDSDAPFAHAIVPDLQHYLGAAVEIEVISPTGLGPKDRPGPVLVSPRDWGRISRDLRRRRGVYRLDYEIAADDLTGVAQRRGWKALTSDHPVSGTRRRRQPSPASHRRGRAS